MTRIGPVMTYAWRLADGRTVHALARDVGPRGSRFYGRAAIRRAAVAGLVAILPPLRRADGRGRVAYRAAAVARTWAALWHAASVEAALDRHALRIARHAHAAQSRLDRALDVEAAVR